MHYGPDQLFALIADCGVVCQQAFPGMKQICRGQRVHAPHPPVVFLMFASHKSSLLLHILYLQTLVLHTHTYSTYIHMYAHTHSQNQLIYIYNSTALYGRPKIVRLAVYLPWRVYWHVNFTVLAYTHFMCKQLHVNMPSIKNNLLFSPVLK